MKYTYKEIPGETPIVEWFAPRIAQFFKEKYGIEVLAKVKPLSREDGGICSGSGR